MQLKFNLTIHSKKVKFVYVRHLLEEDVLAWPEPRNTGFRVKWIQTPIENSSIFSQIKKYRKYSSNHQFRQLTNIFSFALQSNYKVEDIWDFLFSTKVDLMQKDKNVSIFSAFLQKKAASNQIQGVQEKVKKVITLFDTKMRLNSYFLHIN